MAKFTSAQIKEVAKEATLQAIQEVLTQLGAEQFGDFKFAIPQTVGEQEVWVKLDLVTAQFTDTKVSEAFDPFVAREEWLSEKAIKLSEKEAKEQAKSKKIAKDKAKRKKVEEEETLSFEE